MKKLIALVLIVSLSFLMIACNKTKESEPTSNTTSTEDSATTETTTTQETTSESVYEEITYEMYANALQVAFKAGEEGIDYVTNDGEYIEHGAYASYHPHIVTSGYGVFLDEENVNDYYDYTYERIQSIEFSDKSFLHCVEEEEYQIIYAYVTGIEDLSFMLDGNHESVFECAEDFGMNPYDFSIIYFWYFAGNQLISTTVITDTNEGIEAMDTFISELGLPEV